MTARLDRRGRRIGDNPWREFVMAHYVPARLAWEARAEAEAKGYATELAEFAGLHPAPTLRRALEGLAGWGSRVA